MASQGKTNSEAKKNLKEAVELYLEEAAHSKISKHKPPMITSISIPAVHPV